MKESLEKIDKRVEELESQLSDLVDNVYNRKLGIAIVIFADYCLIYYMIICN